MFFYDGAKNECQSLPRVSPGRFCRIIFQVKNPQRRLIFVPIDSLFATQLRYKTWPIVRHEAPF